MQIPKAPESRTGLAFTRSQPAARGKFPNFRSGGPLAAAPGEFVTKSVALKFNALRSEMNCRDRRLSSAS
jgi:hypothetical protein